MPAILPDFLAVCVYAGWPVCPAIFSVVLLSIFAFAP